jgi:isoquinoline 1-oxidoreductase subunit alpha
MSFTVNGRPAVLPEGSTEPAMPLLWVLRDVLNLTGTKYGCGIGACGACTVRIDGVATRSCITPLSAVQGRAVQTIEGLGASGLHAVQAAWIAHQVPQCGYCQSGVLMAAAALIERRARPSDAEIDEAITHLCRCGTTPRMRAAIVEAAARLHGESGPSTQPVPQPGRTK